MRLRPLLWHLPVSHYSEKVRWALDHKQIAHDRRALIGGLHIPIALMITRGHSYTLPILELGGRIIGDSTEIIAALEEAHPQHPLYPEDPGERQRALALEDWFDHHLGPDIRRYVFHALRGDQALFDELAASQIPPAVRRYRRVAGAYGRTFTGVRYRTASNKQADEALKGVTAAFDRLESELGDRQYLAGDRFTVADLTAASLFYPLVLPPEGPLQMALPPAIAEIHPSLSRRRGYLWVEQMFARHRRADAQARLSPR
ncbi:MAG TPA: glutathione S-transferase family protein [Solirubrobacteraceae bacterium]|nr:glutathione S-transferase family protein [Solirubrobacteraceae bacterium]